MGQKSRSTIAAAARSGTLAVTGPTFRHRCFREVEMKKGADALRAIPVKAADGSERNSTVT